MSTLQAPSLRDALADVPDFRQAQGRRYELLPVLLLCCVAVMCGATGFSAHGSRHPSPRMNRPCPGG